MHQHDNKEESFDELTVILRRNNRALRTVNRKLRNKIKAIEQQGDEAFKALCEVNVQAEQAMQQLWEMSGLDCSPNNYAAIIDYWTGEQL
jgi:hypothetical protein